MALTDAPALPSGSPVDRFGAAVLAGALSLFLGALFSGIAYARTYEAQWANFAAWLQLGGLVLATVPLLIALSAVFWRNGRQRRPGLQLTVLALVWVLSLLNALVHARDAWAMMPAGLVLSAVVAVLACLATWTAFSGPPPSGKAP